MRRRSLATLLAALVACGSLAAIERSAVWTTSAELHRSGADHPAIHQPARPEPRLGRSQGLRGLDPGPLVGAAGAVAATFATPALLGPSAWRVRGAELETFRAGRPVSPSRGSRGPPGRLS